MSGGLFRAGKTGRRWGSGLRDRYQRAVAAEIARLLALGRAKKAMLGAAPLDESHIAILVRKNAEAMAFKKLLAQAGIPSVIYSSESVFASDEVHDFRLLMLGMIHCEEEGYLLAALTTPFFGLCAGDIAACLEEEESLESWRVRFRRYAGLWQGKGFLTLFFTLLEEDGARRRLRGRAEKGVSPTTGIWRGFCIRRRRRATCAVGFAGLAREHVGRADSTKEDQQLRLETDRNSVPIVTIHKSKGLEYPVCFCPFAWETGPQEKTACAGFSRRDKRLADYRRSGLRGTRPHRALASATSWRKLPPVYVALTRAKNRCYFVWGNIKNASAGAASYLYGPADATAQAADETMLEAMRNFAEASGGAIRITRLEAVPDIEERTEEAQAKKILYRPFAGKIDLRRKIASYTYLTRAAQDEIEWDEQTHDVRRAEELPDPREAETLLAFPPGATSGILLHEILEKIDFTRVADERTKSLVIETLEKFGYPRPWQEGIGRMLQNLVQTKLPAGDGKAFCLSQIAPAQCLRELEFYFPLQSLSPAKLLSVLESEKARERRTLHFPPVQGFLKGFIDMLFEYEGRFYLTDWKSNDLGGHPENYAPDGLRREMMRSFYDVQYLIYTVAVDAYLKARKPNYTYDGISAACFISFSGAWPLRRRRAASFSTGRTRRLSDV